MSRLIEIKIGEKVREISSGRVGILKDIKLAPNGMSYPELVAILYVYMEKTNSVACSVSSNWEVDKDYKYDEFYPSVHMGRISDEIRSN